MKTPNFLERNKKKSTLALLLLLLRRRKEVAPLLAVALLLVSFIFVGPMAGQMRLGGKVWGALLRIPVINYPLKGIELAGMKLALKFGYVTGGSYVSGSYSQMIAAFNAAREEKAGRWSALWRAIAAKGSKEAGGSAVNVVQMDLKDLSRWGGRNLNGVLTPEEAKRFTSGVYLAAGDMRGERAGFIAQADAAQGGFGGSGAMGPYAGAGFFASGPGIPAGGGIPPPGGDLPDVGVKKYPGEKGTQSEMYKKATSTGKHSASNIGVKSAECADKSRCPFRQLNDAHVYNSMASEPRCRSTSGCPPEYAMTNSGAVYDKVQLGGAPDVLTSPTPVPDLDGITGDVSIPSDSELSGLQSNADQLEKDAKACQEADALYHPQEESLMDQITAQCEKMTGMNCMTWIKITCPGFPMSFFVSCSTKKNKCNKEKDHMYNDLQAQYNNVIAAHVAACPFMQKGGASAYQLSGPGC